MVNEPSVFDPLKFYCIYEKGDIILQLWPESKYHFLHAYAQFMSELCSKFQIPAKNAIGDTNSTTGLYGQTICHSRGHNFAIMT